VLRTRTCAGDRLSYGLLSGRISRSSSSRRVVVVNPLPVHTVRRRRDVNPAHTYTTATSTEHSTVGVADVTSASRGHDITSTSSPLQSDTDTAQTTWSASTTYPINVTVVSIIVVKWFVGWK